MDLRKRAANATDGAPVWRIAISEPHFDGSNRADSNPSTLREQYPNTYSFDPDNPFEVDGTSPPPADELEFDRYILFQHFQNLAGMQDTVDAMSTPGNTIRRRQVFFVPNGANGGITSATVAPGRFLSLIPRSDTRLGSQLYAGDEPVGRSAQRFEFDAARGVASYGVDGTPTDPSLDIVAPTTTYRVKTFPPDGWANGVFEDNLVGLNVSEPLPRSGGANYYREPMEQLDSGNNAEFPLNDAYVDYDDTTGTSARDQPEDLRAPSSPISELSLRRRNLTTQPEPFLGTEPEFCSAFLQRLADPTRPFDATLNPYMNVDWIPIDLTVFSGEEAPAKVDSAGYTNDVYAHQSRQRNGLDANDNTANVLFTYKSNDQTLDPATDNILSAAPTTSYFEFDTARPGITTVNFDATVGYLNFEFYGQTIGNAANAAGSPITDDFRGLPETPFALHDWLNRPFASHYELMLIPATSPGRLHEEFSVSAPGAPEYFASGTVDDLAVVNFHGSHRHLLNFFQSSITEDDTAQFPRIFDYVGTLPRFRGEVDLINPERVLLPTTGTTTQDSAARVFADLLQAPFCFQHDGERQGQVNLNTVADYEVWRGVMQGHLNATERAEEEDDVPASFESFKASRRGYAVGVESTTPQHRIRDSGGIVSNAAMRYNYATGQVHGDYPTEFGRPFRGVIDSDLAPIAPQASGGTTNLRRNGALGTLLRPGSDAAGADQDRPFFVRSETTPHRNALNNPFMKYRTLTRMPNLASGKSNVFVMRLTLGFFEVDAATLSLGREYNEDIAQNQRYQMMYVIDRSKPVAFIPGQNTNVRDTIVYERLVE